MTSISDDVALYKYDDKDAFASLDHPGYSLESDPNHFAGGWLAHRKGVKEDECWVKQIGPKLTVSEYKIQASCKIWLQRRKERNAEKKVMQ
jgi:uncharacterized protein YodC (DUF2158 family)